MLPHQSLRGAQYSVLSSQCKDRVMVCQDKASAEAIGQHSYNELVSMLVSALGDETPPHLLTPTAIAAHSRDASFSSRPSAKHGFLSPPPQAAQPPAAAMSQPSDSRQAGANPALPAESSRGSVDSLGSTLKVSGLRWQAPPCSRHELHPIPCLQQ